MALAPEVGEGTAIVAASEKRRKARTRVCPQDMRHGASLWAVPLASNVIMVTGVPVALMGVLWRNLPRSMALALNPRDVFTVLSASGAATALVILGAKKGWCAADEIAAERRNTVMVRLYILELILGAMSAFQGVSLSIANRVFHLEVTPRLVGGAVGASLGMAMLTGLFFPSLRRLAPLVAESAQDIERKVGQVKKDEPLSIQEAHQAVDTSLMKSVATSGIACRRVTTGKLRDPTRTSGMAEVQQFVLPVLNGVLVYNNIKTLMDTLTLSLGRALPNQSPAFFIVALTLLGQVGIELEDRPGLPRLLRAALRRCDEFSNALQGAIQSFYALNIVTGTVLLWNNPNFLQELSDRLQAESEAVSPAAIVILTAMLLLSIGPGVAVGLTHHLLSALNTGLSTKVPDLFGRMRAWCLRQDAAIDLKGGVISLASLTHFVSTRTLVVARRGSQGSVRSLGAGSSSRSLPVPEGAGWIANPLQAALVEAMRAPTPMPGAESNREILVQWVADPATDDAAVEEMVRQASHFTLERGDSAEGASSTGDTGETALPSRDTSSVEVGEPQKKWPCFTLLRVGTFLLGTACMVWRGVECAKDSGCDWKADARGVVTVGEAVAARRQLVAGNSSSDSSSNSSTWVWGLMLVSLLILAASATLPSVIRTSRAYGGAGPFSPPPLARAVAAEKGSTEATAKNTFK